MLININNDFALGDFILNGIKSNAHNFSEFIESGVDVRTGSFSINFKAVKFLTNRGSGPNLDISLSYSFLNKVDTGFGHGWSFPVSRFNNDNNQLYLSSGQNFKIEWNRSKNEYDIPYRKLKDIRVLYDDSKQSLVVVHKDGSREIINYETGLLDELISTKGTKVTFSYATPGFGNEPILWKIEDEYGDKVEFDWWTDITHRRSIITHFVDNEEANKIDFYIERIGLFNLITYVNTFDDLSCGIQYTIVSDTMVGEYALISQVEHATGLIENVNYNAHGYRLPSGAPYTYLPCVIEHRIEFGANQGSKITEYSYDAKNYLGYLSGVEWRPDRDTLFYADQNYQYSVTERCISNLRTVTHTFNKYHLRQSVDYLYNDQRYQFDQMEYFAELDRSIDEQPENYALLKSKTNTYYNSAGQSKDYTVEYDFDEYGNEIFVKQHDGSQVIREFYPLEGAAGSCPRSPDGFVCQLKKETLIPSNTSNGEVSRIKTVKYVSLEKINNSNEYYLLESEIESHDRKVRITYYTNIDDRLTYGCNKTVTTVINNYESTISYDYKLDYDFGGVKITRTLATHDDISNSESKCVNFKNGKPIEYVEPSGLKTLYGYDYSDELVSITYAAGTNSEAQDINSYSLSDLSLTSIDARGSESTTYFNCSGKEIKITQKDESGNKRVISELFYDCDGQLIKQIDSDWLDGVSISLTTWYEYDAMGEVSKVILPDGRVEMTDRDLVTNTKNYQMIGCIREVVLYNDNGLEIKKSTYDWSNNLIKEKVFQYDAYSNLILESDTNGHAINYQYDHFDRVITVEKNVDGTTITQTLEYPSFTSEEVPSRISLNGTELGYCQYDGLLRKVFERTGSTETYWDFDGASLKPNRETKPTGEQITYQYHPQFKDIQSKTSATIDDCYYQYDDVLGDLVKSYNSNFTKEYRYNSLGQLVEEDFIDFKNIKRTSKARYSLGGLTLYRSDFFGNQSNFEYDSLGRLVAIDHVLAGGKRENVVIDYNAQSQISSYRVSSGSDVVVTDIEYNALGMEIERVITVNSQFEKRIVQTFNRDLLLCQRVQTTPTGTTIEEMEYDEVHRLLSFQVSGEMLPQDEYGRTISSQVYQYDIYNNPTQVKTNFSDGNSDTAQYYYDETDPVKLIKTTHTYPDYPAEIIFSYDADGNLLCDQSNNRYQYDAIGQLVAVYDSGNNLLSTYQYDAEGKLSLQRYQNQDIQLYYNNDELINEYTNEVLSSYLRMQDSTLIRNVHLADEVYSQFIISNSQGCAIQTLHRESGKIQKTNRHYLPYGQG